MCNHVCLCVSNTFTKKHYIILEDEGVELGVFESVLSAVAGAVAVVVVLLVVVVEDVVGAVEGEEFVGSEAFERSCVFVASGFPAPNVSGCKIAFEI